jgi:hypothetical protein
MHATRLSGPWGFRDGLFVLLSFIGLFILFSVAHFFLISATIGTETYLGDGPRMPPSLLAANQAIKIAAIFAAIWLVALKFGRLSWQSLGFRSVKATWIYLAIGLAVLMQAMGVILAKTLVGLMPEWSSLVQPRYGLGDASLAMMGTIFLLTIIATPIAEEIFFRGFLFQWMATNRPIWLAVLVSSLMFGVSHIVPPQVIFAFLLSLALIGMFLVTRSIWPSIACHITNNLLGVLLSLGASGGMLPSWLTPPAA